MMRIAHKPVEFVSDGHPVRYVQRSEHDPTYLKCGPRQLCLANPNAARRASNQDGSYLQAGAPPQIEQIELQQFLQQSAENG